jgi:hypothetical protein
MCITKKYIRFNLTDGIHVNVRAVVWIEEWPLVDRLEQRLVSSIVTSARRLVVPEE